VKDGEVAENFQPSDNNFVRGFLAIARCSDIFCRFLLLLHWENCNPFNSLEILIVSRCMVYTTSRYHKGLFHNTNTFP